MPATCAMALQKDAKHNPKRIKRCCQKKKIKTKPKRMFRKKFAAECRKCGKKGDRFTAIDLRGPWPKSLRKKETKRRFNYGLPSVLTMTMVPPGTGCVILSASCPGMWEINDHWSYGFPRCMGGTLGGGTVWGAYYIKL